MTEKENRASAADMAEANERIASMIGLHGVRQDDHGRRALLDFLPFSIDEIREAAGLPPRNTAQEN